MPTQKNEQPTNQPGDEPGTEQNPDELQSPSGTKEPKELIIQQKVYDMIMYGYPALDQFPKSQKFSLAADIKKCMDTVMRLVITANKKYTKKTTLQELDIEVASLKVYVRMAMDLKYLPIKKYEVWTGKLVEVGRMVGGWIKSAAAGQVIDNFADDKLTARAAMGELKCGKCTKAISVKVKKYSLEKYNEPLCYDCQRDRDREKQHGGKP